MPLESSNLPINLTAAEQSQLLQNVFQMQERAMNQAAAVQSQDQGKKEATEQVQDSKDTENKNIQSNRKDAQSQDREKREKGEAKEGEKAAPQPTPPDPIGRGQIVDMEL